MRQARATFGGQFGLLGRVLVFGEDALLLQGGKLFDLLGDEPLRELWRWFLSSGGILSSRLLVLEGWEPVQLPCSRSWLYQSTHCSVANSTCSIVFQGPCWLISSVLYSPIVDSATALSYPSPMDPIEASAPASTSRWVKAKLVYCSRRRSD